MSRTWPFHPQHSCLGHLCELSSSRSTHVRSGNGWYFADSSCRTISSTSAQVIWILLIKFRERKETSWFAIQKSQLVWVQRINETHCTFSTREMFLTDNDLDSVLCCCLWFRYTGLSWDIRSPYTRFQKRFYYINHYRWHRNRLSYAQNIAYFCKVVYLTDKWASSTGSFNSELILPYRIPAWWMCRFPRLNTYIHAPFKDIRGLKTDSLHLTFPKHKCYSVYQGCHMMYEHLAIIDVMVALILRKLWPFLTDPAKMRWGKYPYPWLYEPSNNSFQSHLTSNPGNGEACHFDRQVTTPTSHLFKNSSFHLSIGNRIWNYVAWPSDKVQTAR